MDFFQTPVEDPRSLLYDFGPGVARINGRY
jgi:hypothetical protein